MNTIDTNVKKDVYITVNTGVDFQFNTMTQFQDWSTSSNNPASASLSKHLMTFDNQEFLAPGKNNDQHLHSCIE